MEPELYNIFQKKSCSVFQIYSLKHLNTTPSYQKGLNTTWKQTFTGQVSTLKNFLE